MRTTDTPAVHPLKARRDEMNYASLRDLALRTGASLSALRRVETGVVRNAVTEKTYPAIIYLGLSPVEFQRAHEAWLDAQRAEVSP